MGQHGLTKSARSGYADILVGSLKKREQFFQNLTLIYKVF